MLIDFQPSFFFRLFLEAINFKYGDVLRYLTRVWGGDDDFLLGFGKTFSSFVKKVRGRERNGCSLLPLVQQVGRYLSLCLREPLCVHQGLTSHSTPTTPLRERECACILQPLLCVLACLVCNASFFFLPSFTCQLVRSPTFRITASILCVSLSFSQAKFI